MNSTVIIFLCLVFLGKLKYFSTEIIRRMQIIQSYNKKLMLSTAILVLRERMDVVQYSKRQALVLHLQLILVLFIVRSVFFKYFFLHFNLFTLQKTVYSSNNNAVERFFSSMGSCTEGSVTGSLSVSAYQYCCTTDLCNEASIEKTSFIFAVISATIAMLFIK